jgi:hypothetical protein
MVLLDIVDDHYRLECPRSDDERKGSRINRRDYLYLNSKDLTIHAFNCAAPLKNISFWKLAQDQNK